MSKHKKTMLFLSLLAAILLSLAGCSSKSVSSPDSQDKGGSMQEGFFPGTNNFVPEATPESESKSELEPEKVIVNIHLNFETTEFDKTNSSLMQIIEKNKAYVENSNISYNQYYGSKNYRQGYYSIRVPKDAVSNFRKELSGIGNMISENVSKEDATKQYRDTASRLKVVEAKEQRLLELLNKAQKIEDIIALENQLTDTIYEKEQLKSTLLHIDDQVDYSTIYLNIQEVDRLSNLETVETTFGTRLKNAINESVANFVSTLQNLTISLIYIIPFLLAFTIVCYPIYWLAKKARFTLKNKGKLLRRRKSENTNKPPQ